MDGSRFDAMTRRLLVPGSRRGVLRGLVAGALAGSLTRLGLADGLAGCKGVSKKCDKSGDCCRGMKCKQGKCACGAGGKKCGDACCGRGERCLESADPAACCPDLKVCGKTCCPPDRVCICAKPGPFDPDPDPDELCRCVCPDGYKEDRDGNCICPNACGVHCCEKEDGEECCFEDGEPFCALVNSSEKHCGKCGHACPADRVCQNGECVCSPEHLDCGGYCVPRINENSLRGCCTTADCGDDGSFCCTPETAYTCDPKYPCPLPNICMGCL